MPFIYYRNPLLPMDTARFLTAKFLLKRKNTCFYDPFFDEKQVFNMWTVDLETPDARVGDVRVGDARCQKEFFV